MSYPVPMADLLYMHRRADPFILDPSYNLYTIVCMEITYKGNADADTS